MTKAPILTLYLTTFLYFWKNLRREEVKKPKRIKGIVKPKEYDSRYNSPLRDEEAIIRTEERIGPIQGVQEKEKEKPKRKDKRGPLALYVSIFILFSFFAPYFVP